MTVQTHWLAFYADRFIKETSQLNPFEVATYYRLFENYAQTGHLVNDPYMLADMAKLNSAMPKFHMLTSVRPDATVWSGFIDATIKGLLTRFFELAPDGTYHHRGWDSELAKAAAKYEARAKGGRNRSLIKNRAKGDINNGIGNDNKIDTDTHIDNDIETYNNTDSDNEKEQTTRARTRTSEQDAEWSAQRVAELEPSPSLILLEGKDKGTDMGSSVPRDTEHFEEPARPNNGKFSPEVNDLVRELTRESLGHISFLDKHKMRLSETLKKFTVEEIAEAFDDWEDTQTYEEMEKYGAGQFVQIVADKCEYLRASRAEEEEYEKEKAARIAQKQAEAEQRAAETKRREEENFAPLADVLCASA